MQSNGKTLRYTSQEIDNRGALTYQVHDRPAREHQGFDNGTRPF